jgi:hypothetical protein
MSSADFDRSKPPPVRRNSGSDGGHDLDPPERAYDVLRPKLVDSAAHAQFPNGGASPQTLVGVIHPADALMPAAKPGLRHIPDSLCQEQ